MYKDDKHILYQFGLLLITKAQHRQAVSTMMRSWNPNVAGLKVNTLLLSAFIKNTCKAVDVGNFIG